MTKLVGLEGIVAARGRLRGLTRVTPLLPARDDTGWLGDAGLWLKCENLQLAGAFKIRGASNMALGLSEEDRRAGLLTYSSGNHGLAIALTARTLGVPAVIVMPTTAPPVKVEGARRLGAEVLFEGTTTLERKARAEVEAGERGMTIVPPFDHERIVEGQGTLGLEIMEQCPGVRRVYVQIGGGGLISGVATAIKRGRPDVEIVGVEPAGAARMTASIAAGRPTTIAIRPGLADGLLAVRPGDITFRHVQAFVDRIVTIDEPAIAEAVRWLFGEARIVAEPSGAITVAAVAADRREGRVTDRAVTVAVISGGNVEASVFARLIGGAGATL
ncbi:MAG TPA: threonine/serine dehydratase [Vicinamibacterales bacterium]|nr:threonine/serine dehydratase [Vicinamibacterales bacterium]